MLKPLIANGPIVEPEYGSDSPIVKCENSDCSNSGPTHLMINVAVVVNSPGHPSLVNFQCPQIEHWACSLDCWRIVAHACVDEHMHQLLTILHQQIGLIKE